MASLSMVCETSGSSSYSLASFRQRPSQPRVRFATKRSTDFLTLLDQLGTAYGTEPRRVSRRL